MFQYIAAIVEGLEQLAIVEGLEQLFHDSGR
jgi:hypothetical protein